MNREVAQALVVAGKDHGQRAGQKVGQDQHGHAGRHHDGQAPPEKAAHLGHVARAIGIAHEGRHALGVADEDRAKDHPHVHDDAVGRDAIRADECHELQVVDHAHHRGGDGAHQLGRAVGADPDDEAGASTGPDQAQEAGIPAGKVGQRHQTAHELGHVGGHGSAGHAPAKDAHEEPVQHHVGQARGHGDAQAQAGLAGRHHEGLEEKLQGEGRQRNHADAAVEHADGQHVLVGA